MTTTLLNLELRGLSRVRLFFSGPLAAGAFTSLAYYAVANADGAGSSPTSVVAVFAVSGDPDAVEVAFEPAMTPGALYSFSVEAIPTVDGSNPTASLGGRPPLPLQNLPNVEPSTQDVDLLFYGRDLLHDGNDFVETASGDLATVSGRANWLGAIGRRLTSYGLPWDPTYGPRADQYVNAPDGMRLPLAGSLVAQARADDRTKQAKLTGLAPWAADPSGNGWIFQVTIVGKDGLDPATIDVPSAPATNGA